VLVALTPPLTAQRAPVPIGTGERVLRAVSTAVIAVDLMQTHHGLQQGYHETNPLLGTRPSALRLNLTVGAVLAANTLLVPRIKSPTLRKVVWAAVTLRELLAVSRNARVTGGVHLGFRF
jgi:hypothetical protein